MSSAASASPERATEPRSRGKTSSPSTTNITTCATKASPSWNVTRCPAEPRRGAADGEPDQVDGQEAAAAAHVGDPERERRGGDRGDRRERADRVGKARERPGRDDAEPDPDHQAEAELAEEQQREIGDPVVRLLDPVDQADRQRDRHRVVAAGLRLERAGQATLDAGEAQRREDRRGVGRGHDRAEEDRLEPGKVEQRVGGKPGQERRHHHADRRQQGRRDRDLAQPPPRGGEPALEEDRRQRHHAHLPRELGVVELDSAQAVGAEQHPEPEERDQRRHARRASHRTRRRCSPPARRRRSGGSGPRPRPYSSRIRPSVPKRSLPTGQRAGRRHSQVVDSVAAAPSTFVTPRPRFARRCTRRRP